MSENVLPPNPCLLAIILITKTRDGTNEVFHYPPNPGAHRRRRAGSSASAAVSDGSSSDGSTSSNDEDDYAAFEDAAVNSHGRSGISNANGGGAAGSAYKASSVADDSGETSSEKANGDQGAGGGASAATGGDGSIGGGGGGGSGDGVWSGRGGLGAGEGRGRHDRGYLGLPAGFHHFLCPPSSFNKRRFELTIDQLVFLGRPAYAREDGTWRKREKRERRSGARKDSTRPESVARTVMSNGAESAIASTVKSAASASAVARRRSLQLDSLADAAAASSETDSSAAEKSKTDGEDELSGFEAGYGHELGPHGIEKEKEKVKTSKETLNMFNIVFVLNPSPTEYQRRVDDMYKFVVKKFARALRWEQTRYGLILKESERLRYLNSRNSSMDTILKQSPLARAIADVFLSISASKIAQIDLTPRTSFSLQLPQPTSISVLPSLTEAQIPGVWLTTSNSVASADILDVDLSTSRSRLAAHFALLLLAPPASIIAEVSATNSPLVPKLAHYLQHSRPTKSFAQVAQTSGISLAEVQFLASHLIYWRRARAVPPLHHRDIYITSPNADMKRLRVATVQFTRSFPTLPGLPKLLSMLSVGPRPYSTLIPTKDHKEAYMEMLAWLLRGGWVTQLRSYGWVRVSPEIRTRAREIMRAEELAKEERRRRMLIEEAARQAESSEDGQSESGTEISAEDGDTSSAQSSKGDDPGEADLPSGLLTPTPMESSMYSTNSGDSVETTRTTIPVRSKLSHSHLSIVENVSYDDHNASDSHLEKDKSQCPVLVMSPSRASGIEARYLTAIAARMEEEDGRDAREAWETCLKYFNGEHAMEKIAIREGWKRKKVEALRARWRTRGVLLEVRHW